ncbi:selenocysteine-specific translation elongation factor [Serinicoccus sediminis]|uniref:selenocysteine-specific translation elongation factor n=1 Tax=Serinicoccus sediminis TaxID=2306021 RepID=UPI001020E7EB|nr:selenocysteine-specific translation elongation factor [Serinicoccus sediminis]
MSVVATAGHVDHGKSALVRALTGMEPDRWEAERRRGLTLDLGYAWTTLPEVGPVAFVDVPGHRRFIGNMLSGIGPAAGVLLVVAADGGWSAQSEEHLRAVHALRLRHGVLVVTRSDLADPAPTLARARGHLRGTSLDGIPAVAVSARTGEGIDLLRTEIADLVRHMPPPPADAPVRLWVDRSFSVRGAGTVVTGTLPAGRVRAGDTLTLTPTPGGRPRSVGVRGVHSRDRAVEEAAGPARVALNLRGVDVAEVGRGQALLSPGHPWWLSTAVDVLLDEDTLPAEVTAHVGTAAVPARLRPLGGAYARVTWGPELPLGPGDRLILREPGREGSLVGALVLDAVTPPLRRTGAARLRASALEAAAGRTAVVAGRQVSTATADAWRAAVDGLVARRATRDPLTPWVGEEPALAELRRRVGVPDLATLRAAAAEAGLTPEGGRLVREGSTEEPPGLTALLRRLRADPLDSPSRPELAALSLGPREVAAAARAPGVLRLPGDVLLGAGAVDRTVRQLRSLPQPFTTAQARALLGTSRRVLVPLLEHLDGRGLTHREPDGRRRVTGLDGADG